MSVLTWMEKSLSPKMNKLNNNNWIQTLKESFMQVLPIILVGSLTTILAILQDFIPSMPDMWTVYNYTMGLLGVMVAFLIAYNYIEKVKLHKLKLIAGLTAISMFLIIIKLDTPDTFDYSKLGAGGMFVAIFVGVMTGLIFKLFGKFSFFKEDSSMPDFVRQWFDNMIPVAILIFATWFVTYVLDVDIFVLINNLLYPITQFAENIVGFTLIYFLLCFFYSMGISTWMIYSLMQPIYLAAIAANADAISKGLAATNINTSEVVFSGWLAIGGVGGTLILCLFMLKAKSKRLRAIGKASLFPSLLNINEPIVFGAVAWNPVMMIPMWIHGLVTPIIVYLWLKAGLAAIPSAVFQFWYAPFPFATWFVSRGLGAMLLLAVIVLVNIVIYYPFFKIYDNQQVKEEVAAEKSKG